MSDSSAQEKTKQTPAEETFEDDGEVTTFLSWHALGRPYQRHSREYYINGFLIVFAIEIILFFFSQYLLMILVLSLAFLSFAMAIVPPHELFYRISSEGVRIDEHYFIWDELYDFYFTKSHGQDLVHIRTKDYFPGELTMVLGDVPLQHVKTILRDFLPFREYVRPTFTEKAGSWLEKNFPLEKPAS